LYRPKIDLIQETNEMSSTKRVAIFLYGVVAYALFFVTILWAMGFVSNVGVPKTIDSGPAATSVTVAIVINSAMLGLFAIQHTIMARKGFKAWITRHIPSPAERSTFVLIASLILLATFTWWQPLPDVVWAVEDAAFSVLLQCLYWFGWFMVFFSSFLINHFDLFGLRQATLALRNQPYKPLPFRMTLLYRFVRHPLLLGFVIAFWSAPVMTEGRLLFAVLTTGYILVGIRFEEHDLAREHGDRYRAYQRAVPMLVPYKGLRGAELQPRAQSVETA
jgi:protein-S-isoprenylcysteine O-methyltransferase Ste14